MAAIKISPRRNSNLIKYPNILNRRGEKTDSRNSLGWILSGTIRSKSYILYLILNLKSCFPTQADAKKIADVLCSNDELSPKEKKKLPTYFPIAQSKIWLKNWMRQSLPLLPITRNKSFLILGFALWFLRRPGKHIKELKNPKNISPKDIDTLLRYFIYKEKNNKMKEDITKN